jgi:hypothetical protein
MLNSPLKFHWTAIFKDGTEISQYDANGVEHLYKEVLDRAEELVSFYIVHITKPLKITVDVTRGILFINGKLDDSGKELQIDKTNIRVIYFRRHTSYSTLAGVELEHIITYFIGYQYNDTMGFNHSVLLQVLENGNIIVGDK